MTVQSTPQSDITHPVVFLVNDHDEAYEHWKKLAITRRTLVHFDAHIDFEWVAEKNTSQLLEASSLKSLSESLRQPHGWSLSTPDHRKMHLGNYLHQALKDGMISVWYWVVPDPLWDSVTIRGKLWKDLLNYYRFRTGPMEYPRKCQNTFQTSFLGVPMVMGPLASLPVFSQPVILNLDVDYLTAQAFERIPPPEILRNQQPWIWPETLDQKMKEKGIKHEAAAIAYSVNGGYTPIAYKFLGEVLKDLLEGVKPAPAYELLKKALLNKEERTPYQTLQLLKSFSAQGGVEAARLYQTALSEFREGLPPASQTFQQCAELDAEFSSSYNSNAKFYQSYGMFQESLEEYAMMKVLLPHSIENLAGEAKCLAALNRVQQAKGKCFQILEWDASHADALLLMGKLLLSEKKFDHAFEYLTRCRRVKPNSVMVHLLLGECLYKQRRYDEAKQNLREALGGGAHFPVTYFLLAKIYWKLAHRHKALEFFMEWLRLTWRRSFEN